MASIPRPLPTGVNESGVPIWDGGDLRRFREAHGVTVGFVARAMAITSGAVGAAFENEHVSVTQRYDRVERYLQAVERMAAMRDAAAATALVELRERVAVRSQEVPPRSGGRSKARR